MRRAAFLMLCTMACREPARQVAVDAEVLLDAPTLDQPSDAGQDRDAQDASSVDLRSEPTVEVGGAIDSSGDGVSPADAGCPLPDAGGDGPPANWDHSLHSGRELTNCVATPFIKQLFAEFMNEVFGPGGRLNAGYNNWSDLRQPKRHGGLDIHKPIGTPVHCLTKGVVHRIVSAPPDPYTAIIIREEGGERHWAYGHLLPSVSRSPRGR
jgi:hypothetical protein